MAADQPPPDQLGEYLGCYKINYTFESKLYSLYTKLSLTPPLFLKKSICIIILSIIYISLV